jgi:hypothetical protein
LRIAVRSCHLADRISRHVKAAEPGQKSLVAMPVSVNLTFRDDLVIISAFATQVASCTADAPSEEARGT